MSRDYGEGSIAKRKDGRFEVRLSVGTQDGKRKRISLGYTNGKREALKLLALGKAQHIAPNGRRIERTGETTEHYLNRWLETIRETKRRSTHDAYRSYV